MRHLFLGILLTVAACSQAGTVPFDDSTGRTVVALTINGKGPYPFVLDTGAPGLLVQQALVDELGLTVLGRAQLTSPFNGTPLETTRVSVASIALGGESATDLEAVVVNMGGTALGMGVLGAALFHDRGPMQLDFEHKVVTIGAEAPRVAVKSWLPFGNSAPLLNAPVRIGTLQIDAHIDTGSPGSLTVPNRFESQIAISGTIRTVGTARTVDAEFEIRAAPIRSAVHVGDATIPLQEIQLADLPVANLGTAALRGLTLYIDWENNRFALTGNPAPPAIRTAGRTQPRFGVQAHPLADGTIEVLGADAGSPAEAIGLQAGDRIVAINGQPIATIPPSQLREAFDQAGLQLTAVRDGLEITLQQQD